MGEVVDFLDFRWINYPIFNVADSAIVIGVGIMLLYTLRQPQEKERLTEGVGGSPMTAEGEIRFWQADESDTGERVDKFLAGKEADWSRMAVQSWIWNTGSGWTAVL